MKVIKRDGRVVQFDRKKILDAITRSFADVDGTVNDADAAIAEKITAKIERLGEELDEMTVEDIQDKVERELQKSSRKDVAKNYILYRDKRSRERAWRDDLTKLMTEKLEASNVQNQNANLDEHSFGGRRQEATNAFMKQYALDYCMSEKSREHHLNNEIYIHDLGKSGSLLQ